MLMDMVFFRIIKLRFIGFARRRVRVMQMLSMVWDLLIKKELVFLKICH